MGKQSHGLRLVSTGPLSALEKSKGPAHHHLLRVVPCCWGGGTPKTNAATHRRRRTTARSLALPSTPAGGAANNPPELPGQGRCYHRVGLLVSAAVDPNAVEALTCRPPGPEPGEIRSVIHLSVQPSSRRRVPVFRCCCCLCVSPFRTRVAFDVCLCCLRLLTGCCQVFADCKF